MRQRVITASLGAPVLLAAVYVGGSALQLLTLLLALIGTEELRRIRARVGPAPPAPLLWAWVLLLSLLDLWRLRIWWGLTLLLFTGLVLSVFVQELGRGGERAREEGAADALLLFLYPAALFPFLPALRAAEAGWALSLLALAVTWATDTVAYFGGRAWGVRRLAPALSPGKTWVGAIAGLASGGAVGALAGAVGPFVPVAPSLLGGAGFGIAASCAAQVGDLFESALKRRGGVKDAGGLLPGHGGVLDRFDSLLFVLPIVYYWNYWTAGF